MNLGELQKIVNTWTDDTFIFEYAFSSPHSYRGYYEDVAFELSSSKSVQHIKDCVFTAYDATFTGWKGGEYSYWDDTLVHLSYRGHADDDYGSEFMELVNNMQEEYDINH